MHHVAVLSFESLCRGSELFFFEKKNSYLYVHRVILRNTVLCYGVATISRLLKIIGLFCRISSLL